MNDYDYGAPNNTEYKYTSFQVQAAVAGCRRTPAAQLRRERLKLTLMESTMDSAAILIGLVITALVIAYVGQPLIRKQRRASSSNGESPREQLEAEYRTTLDAIRDLDFDFQTGKVLAEDYRTLRQRTMAKGTALLKELDQSPSAAAISEQIEAMVQARRKSRPAASCPACGYPCQPGDRFCGKCGTALEAKA